MEVRRNKAEPTIGGTHLQRSAEFELHRHDDQADCALEVREARFAVTLNRANECKAVWDNNTQADAIQLKLAVRFERDPKAFHRPGRVDAVEDLDTARICKGLHAVPFTEADFLNVHARHVEQIQRLIDWDHTSVELQSPRFI